MTTEYPANPTRSDVRLSGGVPTLHINNRPVPGMAYITYFDDRARYDDFAAAGIKLYSVNAYFGSVGINNISGIHAFAPGIFDGGEPDFGFFDGEISKLLAVCPDAMIFPRVDMAMPRRWLDSNPDELLYGDGVRPRECFASPKWLDDVKVMLKAFVDHLETADYAPHIVGYQLSDGQTQEWFPFVQTHVGGKAHDEGYARFIEKNHPELAEFPIPRPESGENYGEGLISAYYEYISDTVASAICALSSYVKELTSRRVAVGCFYGYTMEVTHPGYGHHALRKILACRDVDFICSPVSYSMGRKRGTDFPPMPPIDSLRLHGKLYFTEADIRTWRSEFPGDVRPGSVEPGTYRSDIWLGDSDPEVSRAQIRAAFCRVITTGEAMWWFDMWGGWYHDPDVMRDMKRFCDIFRMSMNDHKRESRAEVAVVIDERSWTPTVDWSVASNISRTRFELSRTGAVWDIYEAADFGEIFTRYKYFVFLAPRMTDRIRRAAGECGERGIGYTVLDGAGPADRDDLREKFRSAGVHIWCGSGDIVWADRYYAGIYSVTAGRKEIFLGKKRMVRPALSGPECCMKAPCETARIAVDMPADRCWIFRTE